MTDNEIIKALECCKKTGFEYCCECPLHVTATAHCKDRLNGSVLDLIKRQQAEIEDLEESKNIFKDFYKKSSFLLNEAYKTAEQVSKNWELAISEAIKDFAKRLEDISTERFVFEGYGENRVVNIVEYGDIYNLAKELTEESK